LHIGTDLFFSDAKAVYKLIYAGSPLLCYVLVFITLISTFTDSAHILSKTFSVDIMIILHFNCNRTWISMFILAALKQTNKQKKPHKKSLKQHQ